MVVFCILIFPFAVLAEFMYENHIIGVSKFNRKL